MAWDMGASARAALVQVLLGGDLQASGGPQQQQQQQQQPQQHLPQQPYQQRGRRPLQSTKAAANAKAPQNSFQPARERRAEWTCSTCAQTNWMSRLNCRNCRAACPSPDAGASRGKTVEKEREREREKDKEALRNKASDSSKGDAMDLDGEADATDPEWEGMSTSQLKMDLYKLEQMQIKLKEAKCSAAAAEIAPRIQALRLFLRSKMPEASVSTA